MITRVRSGLLLGVALMTSCFSRCNQLPQQQQSTDLAMPDLKRPLGSPCSATLLCDVGTCCGGFCADLRVDPRHCGGCGFACPSGRCRSTDAGVSHCGCDPGGANDGGGADGGADGGAGCGALEPTCGADGVCTCGGDQQHACAPPLDNQCSAGACTCSGETCDPQLADGCDVGVSPHCRCGAGPPCPTDRASRCSGGSCRCGDVPICTTSQFCCDRGAFNSHCCRTGQSCCLDGCCDNPCLLFGFCNH